MSNDYFVPTGNPGTRAPGSSSVMRSQFTDVAAAFDKLPALTGNANKAVVINAGGTAQTVTAGTLALAVNFASAGAGAITLTSTGATNVTLPTTGTLATLAGAETLTNKAISGASNTLSNIGNSSLTNSSITINGSLVSLGGSVTVTAVASSIAVGTTGVTSGTIGRVLYHAASDLLGEMTTSGSGTQLALTNSPSFTTPTLGVATATSINKVTITAPASSATLTIADGKMLTVSNILTFTGTDSSSVNFGGGGTVLYGNQTITLSGDITGSGTTAITTTLATVNSNVGSFGSSTGIATFTVNAKGLITAASTVAVVAPAGTLTGTSLPSNVTGSSLTAVGTIGTGTWQGTVIGPAYGGTGAANNAASTIIISGNFSTTFTVSNTTSVTLPTSGTLATLAGSEALTNKTYNGLTLTSTTGTFTLTNGKTLSVAKSLTFDGTDSTTMTFPATSATLGGLGISQTWTGANTHSGTNTYFGGGAGSYTAAGTFTIADGGYAIDLEDPGNRSWGVQLSGNTMNVLSNASGTIVAAFKTDAVGFPIVSTTASAANAYLDAGASNNLLRSTSSLVYKTGVEDLDSWRADDFVDKARPIYYRSLAKADNPNWSWYGLGAEEVAAIDPRLVHWAYQDRHYRVVKTEKNNLGETVETRELIPDAEKVPDGVMYERATVMLIDVVRRLRSRVAALEASHG